MDKRGRVRMYLCECSGTERLLDTSTTSAREFVAYQEMIAIRKRDDGMHHIDAVGSLRLSLAVGGACCGQCVFDGKRGALSHESLLVGGAVVQKLGPGCG